MSEDEKQSFTDAQLLEQVLNGDAEALAIIMSVRVPYLSRLLEALCRSRGVPDGVATAIAYQTIRRAAELTRKITAPQKAGQISWFQKLAYEEFIRWTQDNALVLPPPPLSANSTPPLSLSKEELRHRRRLTELVGKNFWNLPQDCQEIVTLVLVRGLTVENAGKSMDLTVSAANTLFKTAHELLRSWMNVHDGFDVVGGDLGGESTTPPRPPKRPS